MNKETKKERLRSFFKSSEGEKFISSAIALRNNIYRLSASDDGEWLEMMKRDCGKINTFDEFVKRI